jgi:hypothetical protein
MLLGGGVDGVDKKLYSKSYMRNILVMLLLCPRGNNKDVIIIILVHDKVYIIC